MTNLREKLIEAARGKEEIPAGAVADTWLTLGLATKMLHTLLVGRFFEDEGVTTRTTQDVRAEHEWNYRLAPDHEKYLDSEGVPKAPVSLESILQLESHLAVRGFAEGDQSLLQNQRLTTTDKKVALEAGIIAGKFGLCYVVTNDTELIRQIRRMNAEQGLNITLLMPSTIEQQLSHLLPKLGLQLLVPGHVLAQLYKFGSDQQIYTGQPFVSVNRRMPYTLGNTTITPDIATAVLSTDEKTRRVPSRTNDYGIPVAVIKTRSQEEVQKALTMLMPQIPKGVSKFAVLPEDEKCFPVFFRITQNKKSFYYYTMEWARIRIPT